MTAVFAFVQNDVIFLASDTRRGSTYPLTVQKIHSWSDEVILGQAGNGAHQSGLIADLRNRRGHAAHATEQALYALYRTHRPLHLSQVTPPAGTNGTILVAETTTGSNGTLWAYDFHTGNRSSVNGPIAAIGTNPAVLTQLAQNHANRLQGQGSLAADEWAQMCVEDAIRQFPADVGWPCDLLIARPSPLGGRIIVERRIDATSKTGLPEFQI
ncbi:hypothetical protein U1708_07980 [Sphingomonas sp. ZB1N12]|uniref:hypothetical protein n=1 Tax=Sphingomonas arabinosi TaxID=3096160 RepID=UPI002FCA573A